MKYNELEKLKPYIIVKQSTDKTFAVGDVILISPNGDINSVGAGWITPCEEQETTYDFEAEEAHDWEVISINGHEFCRKRQPEKMSIGKNIQRIRKEKGISQKELGQKLGVSQQMIAQYENSNSKPKIETIQKIADVLEVQISVLDDRFEHSTNHEKISHIFGDTDSAEVEAVKLLIARIQEDYEKGLFEQNSGQYLSFYKSMKKRLESEVEE